MSNIDSNLTSAFNNALNEGNLESVRHLTKQYGLAYHDAWDSGCVFLCNAITMGHHKIAEFLLKEGASANSKTDHVNTPLHLAVRQKCVKLVRLLLWKKASIDAQNHHNETALHVAAKSGSADIVAVLVTKKASMTAQNNNGATPLLLAVSRKAVKVVHALLYYAFPDCPLFKKCCPKDTHLYLLNRVLLCNSDAYHIVNKFVVETITSPCNYLQTQIVKKLTYHGFILGREYVDELVLLTVIARDDHQFSNNILAHGPNHKYAEYSPLVLHAAVRSESQEWVRLFLNSGVDVNAKDEKGKTCLHYALESWRGGEYKCVEMIQLLFVGGFDIKMAPDLLHLACRKQWIKVCEVFLQNGAIIDTFISYEMPSHSASQSRLFDCGAIAKQSRGVYKWTPLHIAAANNHLDMVNLLLQFGAEIDIRGAEGETPLHCALQFFDRGSCVKEIVTILLDNGCDANALTSHGATTMDILSATSSSMSLDLTVPVLSEHFIELDIAGLDVSRRNVDLNLRDLSFADFQEQCREEVRRMKSEWLTPQFTLYDILASRRNPLFARSKPLMQRLRLFDLAVFPIYKSLIANSFKKSESRLKMLRSGEDRLIALMEKSSAFTCTRFGEKCALPAVVAKQIVQYLSDADLKHFISCCKALQPQRSSSSLDICMTESPLQVTCDSDYEMQPQCSTSNISAVAGR